jgi:hypothetical protein
MSSYIYSLQQRVEELERQIQIQKDKSYRPPLLASDLIRASQQEHDFIGLGTSLSLFDQLCRVPLLFPAESSSSRKLDNPENAHTLESSTPVAVLPVDCDHLLTPQIQHKLLVCFFERLSVELPPFLPEQYEDMFRRDMTPLLTYSIDPNPWLRIILLYIYAISARFLSRDLHPEYAYIEHACQTELQRALPISFTKFCANEQHALDQVTAACLSILYELVGPGRSKISLDVLNTSQMLFAVAAYIHKDSDHRLQLVSRSANFLSQVEAYVIILNKPWFVYNAYMLLYRSICLHFKRPSCQFYSIRALSNHETTWLDISMEILQTFQGHFERNSEAVLNSVLSKHGHIHDPSYANKELDESALLLTLNQHPIFSADLSWLMSSDPVATRPCSTGFFKRVSQAAQSYLQLMSNKQKSRQTVLCLWLSVEQVIQAGFVWVIYLLYTMKTPSETSIGIKLDASNPLATLTQCNFLLVSLTEKWNPGRPYYASWELIYNKAVDTFSKTIFINGRHS